LPEAIIKLFGIPGLESWCEREMVFVEELIEAFDLAKTQKAGPYSYREARLYNKAYISKLGDKEFALMSRRTSTEWLSDQERRIL